MSTASVSVPMTNESDRLQKDIKWRSGDACRFHIPKSDTDHWNDLLEPLLKKDKIQCDAWNAEVQNLLIFAGLFSAVLTAFVVESYKSLQPDSSLIIIDILSQISNQLDNPGNPSSRLNTTSLNFQPVASSLRINVLWFISLVLSLTTVLVGIISLQWIREHQQYPGLTSRETLSVFNMRTEAAEQWYIPQIFSSLPVILQIALLLFFAGLVDFLMTLNHIVAIPVTIVISLTLCFLVVTTVAPALQGLTFSSIPLRVDDKIPTQCPYKSPQSRLLCHLITSSKNIFHFFGVLIGACDSLKHLFLRIVTQFLKGDMTKPQRNLRHIAPDAFVTWSKHAWINFDLSWLSMRDAYCQSLIEANPEMYPQYWAQEEAIYDTVQGLLHISKHEGLRGSEAALFAAYHCFHDLSLSITGENARQKYALPGQVRRNQYFTSLLHYERNSAVKRGPVSFSRMLDEDLETAILIAEDENAYNILSVIDPEHNISTTTTAYFAELNFRLVGYMYERPRRLLQDDWHLDHPVMINLRALYDLDVGKDLDEDYMLQWALTFDSFFKTITAESARGLDLTASFHAHGFFRSYLNIFVLKLWQGESLEGRTLTACILSTISTLEFIKAQLREVVDEQQKVQRNYNFLFYSAAFFVRYLRRFRPIHPDLDTAVVGMIPTLLQYREYIGYHDLLLEYQLEITELADEKWWKFLDLSEGVSIGYS